MLRRSWMIPAAFVIAPALSALLGGCPGGGSSPYSPFAVPTALPSPNLGNGLVTFALDNDPKRFQRAVFFAPGGGYVGIRPDEISAEQRKDIFPDEIKAQGIVFRLDIPSGTPGTVAAESGKATMTVTDRRQEPPVTYKGPLTVFLQDAGKQRGYPVLGTFRGTLRADDGRTLTVADGQFHGHLATDL